MVELEDFKYGGTNITALRLVDPGEEKVKYFKNLKKWIYFGWKNSPPILLGCKQ